MAISKEKETEILRYHFVEHWRVGTISAQLGLHHTVVDRVISMAGLPKIERTNRPAMIDPYLPFIHETLEEFPSLSAARLFEMAQQRGYPGAISQFRQRIAQLRPRKTPEAYLRLKTLPGEEAQVDWGHFGHITIGNAKRPLMAFVMVLSWSRKIFLRFYLNQKMENFIRGHVGAFEDWNGVPKILLYDNLKSAVLERMGDVIRFHPTLIELAGHYRFQPQPVAVARGNEKGRVERAIRYIRDNFFAARKWRDLDDLNDQAAAWCQGVSADRRCLDQPDLSVREAFALERESLIELPKEPFSSLELCEVNAGKTPYIRFDLNDYSIPHTHVQKILSVAASLSKIRILDGAEVIAQHQRSFDKGQQIEQQSHIDALWRRKAKARKGRAHQRLNHASPLCDKLLSLSVERGHVLKTSTNLLVELLDLYGGQEFHHAIKEALEQQSPYPEGVHQILLRRREEQHKPPPLAVAVPEKARQFGVKKSSLADYDRIGKEGEPSDT